MGLQLRPLSLQLKLSCKRNIFWCLLSVASNSCHADVAFKQFNSLNFQKANSYERINLEIVKNYQDINSRVVLENYCLKKLNTAVSLDFEKRHSIVQKNCNVIFSKMFYFTNIGCKNKFSVEHYFHPVLFSNILLA